MTDLDPALKECPFCGGEAESRDASNLVFVIMCTKCRASTGQERCEADAIAAWNRRAYKEAAALPGLADGRSWRCFHCDEVLTTKDDALAHFGDSELDEPGCKLNRLEGGILALYREAENELRRYRQEDHEAFRTFYALGSDHATALRREEEKGYERGLRDGREAAAALSMPGWRAGDEITGKMWAAGRDEFVKQAERYRQAPSYQGASTVADTAPAEIFNAMLAAAPTEPEVKPAAGELGPQVRDHKDVPSLHETVLEHFKRGPEVKP